VLILALSPQWLLRPEEFSRRATIVGKVVGVRRDGEIAGDCGDGTLDFKRPEGSTQEVAEQDGSTQELAEEHVGWWRKTFRKPSRHAHDVASRAILTMKPAIRRLELTRATIRIAPIVIRTASRRLHTPGVARAASKPAQRSLSRIAVTYY
jgi:hypothetical protein